MNNLNSRYYKSEIFTFIIGGLLIIWSYLGISDKQKIPLFNIEVDDPDKLVKITAFILVFSTIYMCFEYISSSNEGRKSLNSKIRAGVIIIWVLLAFWIAHEIVWKNTKFENVSTFWFYLFLLYGAISGILLNMFLHSCLMIRTVKEATSVGFGRFPPSASAPMFTTIIFALIMAAIYSKTYSYAPLSIKHISLYIFLFPLLLLIICGLYSILFVKDRDGNNIGIFKYRKQLIEISNAHEYMYILGGTNTTSRDFSSKGRRITYDDIQQSFEDSYALKVKKKKNWVRAKNLESLGLNLNGVIQGEIPKIGSRITVFKDEGSSDGLKVMVLPKPFLKPSTEIVLPLPVIQSFLDKYIQGVFTRATRRKSANRVYGVMRINPYLDNSKAANSQAMLSSIADSSESH